MLTPPYQPPALTLEDLADYTADQTAADTTTIHRGYGRHIVDALPGDPCWCSPLELTHADIHGPASHRTERLLAEFFAVH